MPGKPTAPPDGGSRQRILLALAAAVALGAVLAISGETLLGAPTLGRLGTAIALLGAAAYAALRVLGARAARRRGGPEPTGDDGPGPERP